MIFRVFKSFLSLLFVLVGCLAYSQQRPQYTQYIFNQFLLNPAVAGIENYIDIKTGYRNQWKGLEGAPITTYISAHAPLEKKYLTNNATSFPQDGQNPMSRSYRQYYTAAEPHHGVGVQAIIDKAGPFSRTYLNLDYAYHIGLSEKVNVAVGLAAGLSQIRVDHSKIILGNNTSTDPALSNTGASQIKPDLGVGVWLYGPSFFAGLSAQQLMGGELSFSNNSAATTPGKLVPHVFATAGYKLFLSEDIAAIPSLMVKLVSPAPSLVDFNFKVAFRDKLWLGGGYRNKDSFSAMAGFNVGYLFNLSYSYDFAHSELQNVSSGSHEVVLGLLLNNRYKVTCPQRQF